MTFLSPLALIGLSLLALPVLIHLLARRRARRLDFPTLKYLRETQNFRLRPRRIRQPLLLALRLLALVLLVLGIARPLLTLRENSHPTRLILLDASLSMRAQGRAAAAREEARAIINKLGADERAAIISFSSDAVALTAITADRQELLAVVEKYEPQSGAADFSAGLGAANALLERVAPDAVVELDLISDFQQANLASLTNRSTSLPARVRTHAVGAAIGRNAFLLDEAVVKNESGLEISAAEIVSSVEGRSGARRAWVIAGGANELPDIGWHTEANGQLTGHIKALAPDDFDADDERFFALTPPRPARVLLIEADDESNLYVGAALEAAASSVDKTSSLLIRQRQIPARAAELDAYALVALTLHGAMSADELRVLTDYAAAGGNVWLFLARDVDTAQLNALAATDDGRAIPFKSLTRLSSATPLNLVPADLIAPPLSGLTESALQALRAVNVREGYAFEARGGAETLMRWSNGPEAFVSTRTGDGRFLVLGTSTESAASDVGRSPAFPALAYSILRSAAAPPERLSYDLGEAVELGLAPGSDVLITDNAAHQIKAQARSLMQQPLSIFRESGIYRLETEKGVRFVALNPPGAESERALATTVEAQRLFDGKGAVAPAGGNKWLESMEGSGNAWRYFLGAALLLLFGELFVRVRQREKQKAAATIDSQHSASVAEI